MFARVSQFMALAMFLSSGVVAAAEAPPAYVKTVMTAVLGKLEYPKMAKMRHQEGVVTVTFTVESGGAVSGASVEKSSGIQSLDDAALAAVAAAAPFPAPPEAGVTVKGAIRFTAE